MRSYRVRRPRKHDDLLSLLKDREQGVFSTLKSALVFAAAVGFKEGKRLSFTDSGEPIAYTLFSEHKDQPFIYCLALTEYADSSYLRNDKFLEVMQVFEEYAAGGLDVLEGYLDKSCVKESIERYLNYEDGSSVLADISGDW